MIKKQKKVQTTKGTEIIEISKITLKSFVLINFLFFFLVLIPSFIYADSVGTTTDNSILDGSVSDGSGAVYFDSENPEIFETQLNDYGIDNTYLQGCDNDCHFSGDTLFLSDGSTFDLSGLDNNKNININLENGGKLRFADGTISGGIYHSGNPGSIDNGNLDLTQLSSDTNIILKDSSIIINNENNNYDLNINSGEIKDGELIIYEQGGLIYFNLEQETPNYFENVKLDLNNNFGKLNVVPLENSKFGQDKENYFSLTGLDKFTLIKTEDGLDFMLNPTLNPDTKIIIVGNPNINFKSPEDNLGRTKQEIIIDGKSHFFSGDLTFSTGEIYIPSKSKNFKNSFDGIHVIPKENVYLYLDENNFNELNKDNYILINEDKLKLHGKDYLAAFTNRNEGEFGIISNEFNFNNAENNNFLTADEKDQGPYRLIIDFNKKYSVSCIDELLCSSYGDVEIDLQTKKLLVQGDLALTNGIYKNHYFTDSTGEQQYNTQLSSCGGNPSIDATSCSAVAYEFIDGGTIDFSQTPKISRSQGKEMFNFKVGTGLVREDKPLELDKDQIYVLGYYSADWVVAYVTEKNPEDVLGHVGIMFYDDNLGWTVGEATGVQNKYQIKPFSESLFKNGELGKLHSLGVVVDSNNQPVSSKGLVDNLDQMVGLPYGDIGNSLNCATSVHKAMVSSNSKFERQPEVIFNSFTDEEIEQASIKSQIAYYSSTNDYLRETAKSLVDFDLSPSEILANTQIIFDHHPTREEIDLLKQTKISDEKKTRIKEQISSNIK